MLALSWMKGVATINCRLTLGSIRVAEMAFTEKRRAVLLNHDAFCSTCSSVKTPISCGIYVVNNPRSFLRGAHTQIHTKTAGVHNKCIHKNIHLLIKTLYVTCFKETYICL